MPAGLLSLIPLLALGLLGSVAVGQRPEPECHYSATTAGVVASRTARGGFVARVEATADTSDPERRCAAEVVGPDGSVVWRGEGFGARLDPWSGDLDGDGTEDVVLAIEEGGGNRGVWRSVVIGLRWPPPPVIELGFAPDLVTAADGRTFLVELLAFYGLGPSMAESPVAFRVHRIDRGRLRDVTVAHCPSLLGSARDTAFARHAAPTLDSTQLARSRTGADVTYEVVQVRVDAMSRILQLGICGDDAGARALARATWPAAEWADRYRLLSENPRQRQPD